MNLINELVNPNSVILTATQLGILATIEDAPTPEVAHERISGTLNLVIARNMLVRLNLITLSRNRAGLTEIGKDASKGYNIVDDTGGLTDRGQELVDQLTKDRDEYETVNEKFRMIRKL